jgi:F-type H+-transporting ATPase subunit epsilon
MARSFTVDIVTPDRVVLSEEVTSLTAPGSEGSFGILANHAPMLAELGVGELRFRRDSGQEQRVAIGGGFLQVFNNEVTILAETAERAEEIDPERARAARERAAQMLRELQAAPLDQRRQAETALERAVNRLKIAGER